MPTTKDWLTTRQAASLLQVSPNVLLRWERTRTLRSRRRGKGRQARVEFQRGALLALLDSPVQTAHNLLTKADATARLGISPPTLESWLREGHLPCSRLPNRGVRIRREDTAALGAGVSATGARLATCAICGAKARYLGTHLQRHHALRPAEYERQFPGASLWAEDVRDQCRTTLPRSAEQSRKGVADTRDIVKIYYALSEEDRECLMATARRFLAPEQMKDLQAGRKIRRGRALRRG